MHLGVPFIAPRQLEAVESNPGRQFLSSVAWRTGQSGAPPDSPVHKRTVRCTTGHCPMQISFLIWRSRPLAALEPLAHQTLSGAPTSRWLGHVSHADRAADRWPGRPLAHRTVRCTPDSPVNYSRTPPMKSREQRVRKSQSGAPDTVRCTSGQSGAPRPS
jgi:hypothetical protein